MRQPQRGAHYDDQHGAGGRQRSVAQSDPLFHGPAHLIGSAVLTDMLGPFSGTLGLVQSLTRIPSYRLALWNLPYALGYMALLAAVILMLGNRVHPNV